VNEAPVTTAAPAPSAVLDASDARVAVDEAVALASLTFTSRGSLVLVAGETAALFAVLTGVPLGATRPLDSPTLGEAHVVAGFLRVRGHSVADRRHVAITGVALLDPPLPPTWTARTAVAWSARLAGIPERAARELTDHALSRVGLATALDRPARTLALPERRALGLAQAIVASPEVLILEAPLAGLDGAAAEFVDRALRSVLADHAAIVGVSRLDPGGAEGSLTRSASDLLVLGGGGALYAGPPEGLLAHPRAVALTVRSQFEGLRAALTERGLVLEGGPVRCAVALPEGRSSADILAAAASARASIVELRPLL